LAFRGTFEFTLDAKNRLTVPSRFRAAFADGVVLAIGLDGTAGVWHPEDYEAYTAEALAGLRPLSEDYRRLDRTFSHNSWDTELDGAGRVMLPPRLVQHAGLSKDVLLAGTRRCLEIWDREAWIAYNERSLADLPDITARLGDTA